MYRKPHVNQLAFEDFVLPFGGTLRSDNRWVLLAKQIPWAVVETAYAQQFSKGMWVRLLALQYRFDARSLLNFIHYIEMPWEQVKSHNDPTWLPIRAM